MMMMMMKTTTTKTKTVGMASTALSEINAVSSEPTKQYSGKMGEERHLVRRGIERTTATLAAAAAKVFVIKFATISAPNSKPESTHHSKTVVLNQVSTAMPNTLCYARH